MSDPSRKIVPLKPEALPPDKMIVTITVGELRLIVGEIVEEKLRRVATGRTNGLLTVEQAAEFLGYSKDWVYQNWKRIGGRKIGGRGVRFDPADLEAWVKSRG
jgi:excisionase family DNA binding protein